MRRRGWTSPVEPSAAVDSIEPVERKYGVGAPTAGVPGSLYDCVRRYLCAHDGSCSRDELLAALNADPPTQERLSRSQGFKALLNNMRHSGDVRFEGNKVSATSRSSRRVNMSR